MIKKLLSVVLSATALATLSVPAFAADTVHTADSAYAITAPSTMCADLFQATGEAVSADKLIQPNKTIYLKLDGITVQTGAAAAETWNGGSYSVTLAGAAPVATVSFDDSELLDPDLIKIKLDKGDLNPERIKSISLSEKKIPRRGRGSWVKIVLKDDWSDHEFKIAPEITFITKKDRSETATDASGNQTTVLVKSGTKFMVKMTDLFISNKTDLADQEYKAGTGGVLLKPQSNQHNEILWSDENQTLVSLQFSGNSEVQKLFPKLSTKWDNKEYAKTFSDQNAFYFDFIANKNGSTKISSTSRATLSISNPFYDSETGALTTDPARVIIYSPAADGSLTDVTATFIAGENEDGNPIFTTKTRELGTYIFAEKPITIVAAKKE